MAANDDLTLGELARSIEGLKKAIADQNRASLEEQRQRDATILNRLDKLVTIDVHQSDLNRVYDRIKNSEDDITEIKTEARETRNQARQARQWAVAAAIAAAGVVVAALGVLQSGGVGG